MHNVKLVQYVKVTVIWITVRNLGRVQCHLPVVVGVVHLDYRRRAAPTGSNIPVTDHIAQMGLCYDVS